LKPGGETKSVTNERVSVAAYTKDGKKRLLGYNAKVGWTTQDIKTGKFTDALVTSPLGTGTAVSTEVSVYSPDGKTVLSVPVLLTFANGKPAPTNYQLRVYDAGTGKELRAFPARHTEPIHSLARSADGKIAVSGSRDTTARAWDYATGKELSVFKGHTTTVLRVAVSPDGKLAASSENFIPKAKDGKIGDPAVRVWETKTGKFVSKFEGHEGGVNALAITPDGKSVVSIGGGKPGVDGKVWELATGKELARFAANGGSALAIAPDGSRFAVSNSGEAGVVRLWPLP
jgi:WD40 repeat protein